MTLATHNSHEVFWAAILSHPHDNEPRLQYAHWLDERDDPRGEFIRLQCQLDRLPLSNPMRLSLEAREHELLADHEHEWLGGLDPLVDWAVFSRGFPAEISTTADTFIRHGPAIMSLAPIEMVHLDRARDRAGDLAQCAALRRVSFLDLSNNYLRDPGVKALAESPHVVHLLGLNLSSTAVGDAGVRALANSPFLGSLRELYLCDNHISRSGMRALASSQLVQQLEILSLRCNECIPGTEMWRADPDLMLQI